MWETTYLLVFLISQRKETSLITQTAHKHVKPFAL